MACATEQHPKLALRGQKHPDLFRTPAGVQKFRNFVQLSLMKLGHAVRQPAAPVVGLRRLLPVSAARLA